MLSWLQPSSAAELPMQKLTTQIPPDDLLFLVSNHSHREGWAASRQAAVVDVILPLLKQVDFKHPKHILDFGCGCGRILAGWEGLLNDATLTGVDVHPKLAAFCQEHIRFAQVFQSAPYPPLHFIDNSFDFVYAASVFTHMKYDQLSLWANEMARIITSGGLLMVSYHGPYYENILDQYGHHAIPLLRERGYYVHVYGNEHDTFLGSNLYATYLTSDFIRSLFNGFELIVERSSTKEGPSHFAAYQDIAVFKRIDA
jgi:SAM-dependent methyltransferase